jgi:hypothetical protein
MQHPCKLKSFNLLRKWFKIHSAMLYSVRARSPILDWCYGSLEHRAALAIPTDGMVAAPRRHRGVSKRCLACYAAAASKAPPSSHASKPPGVAKVCAAACAPRSRRATLRGALPWWAHPPDPARGMITRPAWRGMGHGWDSVALLLCTTTPPFHTRSTKRFGASLSEKTMRPNPNSRRGADPKQRRDRRVVQGRERRPRRRQLAPLRSPRAVSTSPLYRIAVTYTSICTSAARAAASSPSRGNSEAPPAAKVCTAASAWGEGGWGCELSHSKG